MAILISKEEVDLLKDLVKDYREDPKAFLGMQQCWIDAIDNLLKDWKGLSMDIVLTLLKERINRG